MNIGVIGMGTMGNGIAQQFAAGGFAVFASDVNEAALDKGRAAIAGRLDKAVDKGRLTEDERGAVLGRITAVSDLAGLSDCGLIIECIKEDIAVKKDLLGKLGRLDLGDAIIATNTSSLSITEMALAYRAPGRVIGMHFFNPVQAMALVEVIRGITTEADVNETVVNLARRLGKTPVEVAEAPGFVVNRLLIPMINEAVAIFAEGIASAADIDTAMKLGANHPMGPLELGDLIGLDVCLSIMDILHGEFGDSKYRAHSLLRKMVRGNQLGRKTRKGFYQY